MCPSRCFRLGLVACATAMSAWGPDCVKTRFSWKGGAGSAKPISCSDRLYQSADAQNAHYPFHIVGQDVQGHFGTDVLERLHLEVSGSHPGFYRAKGMLHGLAAFAHLVRGPIEPCLHSLKDG